MSQVKILPITATRWLSLLLCAITAATITVFLSKVGFVQKAYSSLGAILHANSVLHYSSAFLAGIGIRLLLDKFYISHPKRSVVFSWRYPPVTISVLLGLLFIVGYVYFRYSKEIVEQFITLAFVGLKFLALSFLAIAATIVYQAKLFAEKPVFSVVLCAFSAFYLFSAINLIEIEQAFWVFFSIAGAYLGMSIYLLWEQLKATDKELNNEPKQKAELKLENLKDFQQWFKDDSIIKNTELLEPDLQVYAKRITKRLQNGGNKYEKDLAQHIALCGPYGCGKSSIVESIVNDLAKNSQKGSTWIHSDISTWGAASGSVAHVILSNIIDDISPHIDMCAFRALPKHYTEALKSGGSVFQFASTLLAGPVDIEGSFKKLNDVLDATNHKLLITLQDVDRGTGDENEKRLNDIAALLDRLKNRDLSHINFIVAMGNESEVAAEVISKATDYREDVLSFDARRILSDFIISSLEFAINFHQVCTATDKYRKRFYILEGNKFIDSTDIDKWRLKELSKLPFYDSVKLVDKKITSLRELKKILRRVSQIWQPTRLMGEVNFTSLLMSIVLKEVSPQIFDRLLQNENYPSGYQNFDLTDLVLRIGEFEKGSSMLEFFKVMLGFEYKLSLAEREHKLKTIAYSKKADEREIEQNKKDCMWLTCDMHEQKYLQYVSRNINRLKLEKLPVADYSDQMIIRNIRSLFEVKRANFSKLLPIVINILGYCDVQVYRFEKFMCIDGVFSKEELKSFDKTIGRDFREQLNDNKSEYLDRHSINLVLTNLILPNLTVEWLYPLFNELSTRNVWAEQFNNFRESSTFLHYLINHIELESSPAFEVRLAPILESAINKSDLVAATFVFGLLKSFLQAYDTKGTEISDFNSFQFSGVRLTSMLGMYKVEDVIAFLSTFKEADFRCISNASELNKEIRELLHKNHTFYPLVDKLLLSAK